MGSRLLQDEAERMEKAKARAKRRGRIRIKARRIGLGKSADDLAVGQSLLELLDTFVRDFGVGDVQLPQLRETRQPGLFTSPTVLA